MKSHFGEVRQGLISTPREGYRKRGIPAEECESIWLHGKRTTSACLSLIAGVPERIQDKKGFPLMGFSHDWVEWDMPDYTPGCDISAEEKLTLESQSLSRLRQKLGQKYEKILLKTQEYLGGETSDAKELFYIDKALAGVGALEYERQGFSKMDDFHPYALTKLSSSPFHLDIYKTLLKKDFFHVDFFTQYFLLLRLAGDEKLYKKSLAQQRR